jgi:hypothetical protein
MKGQIHKHPKANSNGFDKNPSNINRTGQNRSILSSIKKRLYQDGPNQYVRIDEAEIIDEENQPTGKKVNVLVRLPSDEAIAMHYINRSFKSDKVLIDLINRSQAIEEPIIEENSYEIASSGLTEEESNYLAELGARVLVIKD